MEFGAVQANAPTMQLPETIELHELRLTKGIEEANYPNDYERMTNIAYDTEVPKMSEYVLFTDSCCDLTTEMADKLGLTVLPLCVDIDGDIYYNYLDEREISFKSFYEKLRTKCPTKTSAVNVGQFEEAMEPILASGKDVLYIAFSSGLSGTYNAALIAIEELSAKYPERKIYAVDTLAASAGQGMLCYYAWLEKEKGKTIEEVRDYLEENKLKMCHWFTIDDLMFLKRGGRVSAATAVLGSMLSIKPVLHVDDEGHLINMSKARGRKASIRALADEAERLGVDLKDQEIFISHGDCLEDAEYLAELMRTRFGVKEVYISYVGPVIGSHSGPGTLALFFWGTSR